MEINSGYVGEEDGACEGWRMRRIVYAKRCVCARALMKGNYMGSVCCVVVLTLRVCLFGFSCLKETEKPIIRLKLCQLPCLFLV